MRDSVTIDHLVAFLSRVDRGPGCWTWRGCKNPSGYGRQRVRDRLFYVHRLAYFFATDRDPGELDVCHSCDNPSCVRPDHLFLGTHVENMRDRDRKGRGTGKLTQEQVNAIRARRATGETFQALAARFGVSVATAFNAVTGKTYNHLDGISSTGSVAA